MDLERTHAGKDLQTERQKTATHSLWRANELFRGCMTAAIAGSTVAFETLARSLVEELINAQWSSLSEDNAKIRCASTVTEVHKYMRLNIQHGHALLRDKETKKPIGSEHTREFIKKTEPTGGKEPSLEAKSKASELHILYSRLYRALSITAHGNDHDWRTPHEKKWEKVEALVSVAIALHTAILQSVDHLLVHGEPVPAATLMQTLFPPQG
jgi:hypothetical protein